MPILTADQEHTSRCILSNLLLLLNNGRLQHRLPNRILPIDLQANLLRLTLAAVLERMIDKGHSVRKKTVESEGSMLDFESVLLNAELAANVGAARQTA